MEGPQKRALTSDVHDAMVAANTPRHDFISDDLTARLQNIGSRVRKSVAEGYTTPSASPLTQSPSKSAHTSPVAFMPTANQILHAVYGGSPSASRTAPHPQPQSPSPRKRVRDDELAGRDSDVMDCSDDDSDSDDEVLITPILVGGGFPNVCSTARPVRPLRRPRFPQPSFAPSVVAAQQLAVAASDIAMDYLPANILHQAMGIPAAPTVTVGGDDQALRV